MRAAARLAVFSAFVHGAAARGNLTSVFGLVASPPRGVLLPEPYILGRWHGDCLPDATLHGVCGLVETRMADGQNDSNNTHMDKTPDPAPLLDVKQHADAILSGRQQADSLVAEIQGQNAAATSSANEIEQVRLAAQKAKAEVDAQLAAMQTAVAAMNPQLEAARAAGAELTALSASIQAANAASTETAKQASASIESAKQIASTASEIIGRIEAIRDEAVKTQATIAERNAFIEGGLNHVREVQQKLDAALDAAQRSATAAETHQIATKATAEGVTTLQAAVVALKEKAESDASLAASTRATIERHANTTMRLSQLADSTETRIAQYEAKLTEMQEGARSLQARIDELLLGATNAGLASAFDKRSKMFKSPETLWQWVFIGSLAGLLGLAIWHAVAFGSLAQPPDWQQLARMMLFKLPFVLPLIWLAIHAARQASLAKRMEEEYAFKATTSMSFEGYRRQMAEVGKDLDANSPLAQLCNNTLKTIASPPVRAYDKQRMDPTPSTAAAEIVGPVVEGVSKSLAAKLPDLKS